MLLPDSLEDWVTILEHHKSDVLVETGGFISFHNTSQLVGEVYDETLHSCCPLPNSEDALDYFFFRSYVGGTTCGKVYRREKCGHLRFPVQLRYAEDSTYWLALFREELTWCAACGTHYCYRRNREGSHCLIISQWKRLDILRIQLTIWYCWKKKAFHRRIVYVFGSILLAQPCVMYVELLRRVGVFVALRGSSVSGWPHGKQNQY